MSFKVNENFSKEILEFIANRCDKCRGRGEVDMNVCHGFGNGPRKYWPCTACDGTGMKKPEQARETD